MISDRGEPIALADTRDREERADVISLYTHLAYCVSSAECSAPRAPGKPLVTYDVVLTPAGGRYLITALADAKGTLPEPPPWDRSALSFATGERVIVAGPPTQAKHLRRVLVAAEQAAKIADRYAARVDKPQERYRVYIADKQTWRTWHGVEPADRGHGYTFPLEQIGTDVVLNGPRVLNGERDLRQLLGFLFGKVAILDGITAWRPENDWLESGIADYISFDARRG